MDLTLLNITPLSIPFYKHLLDGLNEYKYLVKLLEPKTPY